MGGKCVKRKSKGNRVKRAPRVEAEGRKQVGRLTTETATLTGLQRRTKRSKKWGAKESRGRGGIGWGKRRLKEGDAKQGTVCGGSDLTK